MKREKFSDYITVATNIAVIVGLVFVIIQLRQNSASLATSNQWALAESSVAVWQPLAENGDLARLEYKVRRNEPLTGLDSLRYEAYVWMRLEQVWSAYELYKHGVLSEAEWQGSYVPSQVRASTYPIVADVIRAGPMPEDLKTLLLAEVGK